MEDWNIDCEQYHQKSNDYDLQENYFHGAVFDGSRPVHMLRRYSIQVIPEHLIAKKARVVVSDYAQFVLPGYKRIVGPLHEKFLAIMKNISILYYIYLITATTLAKSTSFVCNKSEVRQ